MSHTINIKVAKGFRRHTKKIARILREEVATYIKRIQNPPVEFRGLAPDTNCRCTMPDPETLEAECREKERLKNRYNPLI